MSKPQRTIKLSGITIIILNSLWSPMTTAYTLSGNVAETPSSNRQLTLFETGSMPGQRLGLQNSVDHDSPSNAPNVRPTWPCRSAVPPMGNMPWCDSGAGPGPSNPPPDADNADSIPEYDDPHWTPVPPPAPSAVPLPAASWLLMSGLAAFGAAVRRLRSDN